MRKLYRSNIVTDLRNFMGRAFDSPSVFVTGSLTELNKDGGIFVWDDDSVAMDDGFNIIKPDVLDDLELGRWIRATFNIPSINAVLNAGNTTAASAFLGDLTVQNLTVAGNMTTVNSTTVLVADNILTLNYGEVGAGVTNNPSGIEIDRGTLTDYQFVFDEVTDTFRVGEIGSLQPVATREDAPIDGGIATWNNATSKFVTTAPSGFSGSFILNQNVSAQTASAWINGRMAIGSRSDVINSFQNVKLITAHSFNSGTNNLLALIYGSAASPASGGLVGQRIELYADVGLTTLTGIELETTNSGGGSVSTMTGLQISSVVYNASATSTYRGIWIKPYTQATGTGGTVVNNYGLYLDAQTIGTNIWGVYQLGATTKNHFAGNVLLGTTTDAGYRLDVQGTTRLSSSLTLSATPPTGSIIDYVLVRNSTTGEVKQIPSSDIGSLQTSYNNSVSPEIVTNNTNFALTIKRGSGSDNDKIFEGQNGAGTVTASLNGNGLFISQNMQADLNVQALNSVIGNNSLLVGTGPGTLGGDNNLIKPFASSAFLNIKGGSGIAKIILTDDSVNFCHNGSIGFFNAVVDSTSTGTLQTRMYNSGNWSFSSSPVDNGFKVEVVGTSRFNGNVTVGTNTAASSLILNGQAGSGRNLAFITAGENRWILYASGAAESGSNVGSDFSIARFADGGSFIEDTFFIKRSTGNVGIGTTSPTGKLHVVGDIFATSNATLLGSPNIPDISYGVGDALSSGRMIFMGWRYNFGDPYGFIETYGSGSHIRMQSSGPGNVGIGINPTEKLHVEGKIISTFSANDSVIELQSNEPTANIQALNYARNAAKSLILQNYGGNVGIGVIPTEKLHVAGNGLFIGNIDSKSNSNDTQVAIRHREGFVEIQTGNAAFNSAKNLILNGVFGDVGIGISPTEKLHVAGNVKVDGNIIGGNVVTLDTAQTITGVKSFVKDLGQINIGDNRPVEPFGSTYQLTNKLSFYHHFNTQEGAYIGTKKDFTIMGYEDVDMVFATKYGGTTTEKMFLLANGNVGIGTNSPQSRLHVSGASNALTGARNSLILDNITGASNRSSTISFISAATTILWEMGSDFSANGSQTFYIYDAINNDRRFFIDTTGFVAIGNITPTEKLHVAGNGLFTGNFRADGNGYFLGSLQVDGPVFMINSSHGSFSQYLITTEPGTSSGVAFIWAENIAGTAEMRVKDGAGNVTTISPHNCTMIPQSEIVDDMSWYYYSERDGKRINVNMYKAIKDLEELTGNKYIYQD